ncbi:sporulation membrane protein YtaF [Paenibacillus alkalitolerans]|uniref:sporulation membrane protein YtaF n=1 Tax=Paenibacillus alkalitolerans TaxID=2799335 RepID=UPI0018F62EAC|nr:sporulation membrane protein YtaF [Paenibacillus alkalitolerans]
MAGILSLLVLALAVSLDGFSAGISYGIRKIRIPWTSIVIVALCSGIVIYASMAAGNVFASLLSERTAAAIGAGILIAIGGWAIYQVSSASSAEEADSVEEAPAGNGGEQTIVFWEIRRLGLIIKIWRSPSVADVDRSGVISASEALLLGIALSIDSLGAGIGAALVGFPPLLTAVAIAVACGAFIAWGAKLGYLCSGFRWIGKLAVLPGCILVAVGLLKLL